MRVARFESRAFSHKEARLVLFDDDLEVVLLFHERRLEALVLRKRHQ